MKSKKDNWTDHYTRLAKKENYPARSVYKLKEIQAKFKVIKKGNRILDLGCSPGSWSIYAGEVADKNGEIIGIDLKQIDISTISSFKMIVGDALNPDTFLDEIKHPFDIVLSDMAPATTGRKDIDAIRSYELSEAAFSIAMKILKKGGNFVCKNFQSQDSKILIDKVKKNFNKQKIFKPKSSRKASNEIFVIGLGFTDIMN